MPQANANIEVPSKRRKPKYNVLQPGQLLWCTRDFPKAEIFQVSFEKYFQYFQHKGYPSIWVRLPGSTDEDDIFMVFKPHWHVTKEEAFARVQQIIHQEQIGLLEAQALAVNVLLQAD